MGRYRKQILKMLLQLRTYRGRSLLQTFVVQGLPPIIARVRCNHSKFAFVSVASNKSAFTSASINTQRWH